MCKLSAARTESRPTFHLLRAIRCNRVLATLMALLPIAAAAAPGDGGGLADSGVAIAPADAAFFSATLRGREQYDLIVKSNAYAALMKLPGMKRALAMFEEQRTTPGSPLAMLDTFMQLPENEQAVDLVRDMVSRDTFVYGEPSWIPLARLLKKLQQAQQGAADSSLGLLAAVCEPPGNRHAGGLVVAEHGAHQGSEPIHLGSHHQDVAGLQAGVGRQEL